MTIFEDISVEYIDHMGDDLRVANAARVSMGKWNSSSLSERDERLISYLSTHDHWTPFAHCVISLRETVPIFVARQRFKHTVGFVYNEVSRRYVDDPPTFYRPEKWRGRAENVKQGSSDDIIDYIYHWNTSPNDAYMDLVATAIHTYRAMIKVGIAPEQARMVLPQSMMTSYIVTGSLYAWARAYLLRSDSHAQKEIQQLASLWNDIIQPLFPHAWKELTNA